jgi:putative spermidine/putrescine transport system substrate-binding protein
MKIKHTIILLATLAVLGGFAIACATPATPPPPVVQTVVVKETEVVKETAVVTVKETVAVPQTVVVEETAMPQPTTPPAGAMKTEIGPGEGEVDIVAWPGYIERGETDPNYDWVTQFEKDTGCKVMVKTAATSDEMVALMNEGGFDLVTASGDASNRLIAGNRVQEVNINLIPSWNTVDQRLQNAPWHTVDGKHYGVPYQWGPNVLMYNTNVFKEPPKSWSVVFEEQTLPDGKSNKGRVQAYDGPIYVADAALYLMHKKPELGIKNPYELNRDQFNAAIDLLRQQRQIVGRYWHDAIVQTDDFTNEGVVASSSWPFQVNLLQANKQPIASTIPEEGATGWADTTMMSIESKHPNCAYKWMEWSLNPKLQGDLAAWFGSVPAVPAACKGNALLTDTGCETNGFNNFDKIWFWRTPTAKCETQTECVPYHEWVTNYVAVIGGR